MAPGLEVEHFETRMHPRDVSLAHTLLTDIPDQGNAQCIFC
jgi:hypothetical protein